MTRSRRRLGDLDLEPAACTSFARDVERIADIGVSLAPEKRLTISGAVFGVGISRDVFYEFRCRRPQRPGALGPGPCGNYEIRRTGPGARRAGRARRWVSVGNLFGLIEQLSRDLARIYGCVPLPTPGFEGTRRRRR